ncbi:Zinc finger protein [Fusarium oxysporum f. sp. albedinis]|nr:Zinc finger protein [Fusarium oxysporum f. sp. albedinis]
MYACLCIRIMRIQAWENRFSNILPYGKLDAHAPAKSHVSSTASNCGSLLRQRLNYKEGCPHRRQSGGLEHVPYLDSLPRLVPDSNIKVLDQRQQRRRHHHHHHYHLHVSLANQHSAANISTYRAFHPQIHSRNGPKPLQNMGTPSVSTL